jgi:hypothetical protein
MRFGVFAGARSLSATSAGMTNSGLSGSKGGLATAQRHEATTQRPWGTNDCELEGALHAG